MTHRHHDTEEFRSQNFESLALAQHFEIQKYEPRL